MSDKQITHDPAAVIPKELRDAAVKLLASLLTAAGFAGVVAFVGGATLWLRFSAAELPAEQAVSIVPRADLITVGAVYMTTFAVAGLLAVAGAYVIETASLNSWKATGWVLVLAIGALVYVLMKTNDGGASSWVGLLLLASAAAAAFVTLLVVEVTWKRMVGALVSVALALLGAFAWGSSWGLFLALLTFVFAGAVLKAGRTERPSFFWYGTTLFIATVAFGASIHVARTLQTPKVQPVALLIGDGTGTAVAVAALYVAETSDRVYFGRVTCQRSRGRAIPVPESGRILSVPRANVQALAIGALQEVDDALAQSERMLAELRPPPPTPGPATQAVTAVPVPGCPDALPAIPALNGELLAGDEAKLLAGRFRPWLRFDTQERWRPLSVQGLLAEQHDSVRHQICAPVQRLQAGCRDITTADELLPSHARETYLDLVGTNNPESYCAPGRCDRIPADCGSCEESAIYYRVQGANNRYYIDYWWFLRFNDAPKAKRATAACLAKLKGRQCFDHEGDWEGVTVVTSTTAPYRLEFVSIAAHDRVPRYPAGQLELIDGRRPVIYVAAGTHAAYPNACPTLTARSHRCGQTFRRFGYAWPEGRRDGRANWPRNPDASCYQPQTTSCILPIGGTAWATWAGRWGSCGRGKRACQLGDAPRSPAHQPRWHNPSCFHKGRARICDPIPPA